jgi:putative ABC transport system substrate-binding protein
MNRRDFFILVGAATAAEAVGASAQESGKLYKIGIFFAGGPGEVITLHDILRDDLRELGLIEGKNLVFEGRYADNRLDRLPALAAELVSLHADVIVTAGTLAPLATKRATTTIPIVMVAAGDPVGSGLIASLARPGGNVTGTSLMAPELAGKRLELLKDLLSGISRVAVLWNAANPYAALVYKETVGAARILGIEVQSLEVRTPDDFDGALEAAAGQHTDALITVEDPLTGEHRGKIAEFAAGKQLPTISGLRIFVDAGGLMSYGANLGDLQRRSAGYVVKILKGAKPSDLPVEQPTKFELVINLKTAQALGLTIPQTILLRADEVIE